MGQFKHQMNYLSILGLAVLSIVSDSLSKIYYSISSFCLYIISAIWWVLFFKYSTMDLNKIVVIYGLLNLILGVGTGVIFFNEHLTNFGIIGIIMACIAIVLVNI